MTMRGFAGYLLIGCFAALGTSAIAMTGFDLALVAGPQPPTIAQHVNRSLKGDRLDLPTHVGAQPMPRPRQPMPVGCERVFSPLSPDHVNPLGRCLT